jgi:hypothetical protein
MKRNDASVAQNSLKQKFSSTKSFFNSRIRFSQSEGEL